MSAALKSSRRPVRPALWQGLVPAAAPRRHLEDDLQAAVFQFLGMALPPDALAFAVPNGGKRHAREAARMKRLGVTPGVPDVAVVFRGRALFIELKAKLGRVSPEQKEMQRRLIYCGADVMLCRSVEDVERGLREACVPLKASVA